MSAIIDHIQGVPRRIFLTANGGTSLTDLLAFYREYRALRRADESLRKYSPFMSVIGGQTKGGGKLVGRVLDLHNTLIVPANVSHKQLVTFEIIDSSNGISGRDVFDRAPLTPGITVDIDIQIAPTEIIIIGGSGGMTDADRRTLTEAHDYAAIAARNTQY